MAEVKNFDHRTTQQMVGAYDAAKADCTRIQGMIESGQAQLSGGWSGDAHTTFSASTDSWVEGFRMVQSALDSLNVKMEGYRTGSVNTEAENTGSAGWANAGH